EGAIGRPIPASPGRQGASLGVVDADAIRGHLPPERLAGAGRGRSVVIAAWKSHPAPGRITHRRSRRPPVSIATELRPLVLRLAPEYRRSAIYVVVGYVLLVALIVWKRWANVNNGPWVNTVIGLAVFGTATLFLLAVVFRYRIRIDEHGVWRRRFVRWDLWPWEVFEQGLVRHGKLGDQLTYPARGWYWRPIPASLLGEANRALYESIVARYRVPPPPPDVPDSLTLKLPFLATLDLSADGVRVTGHRGYDNKLISWKEVVRADVLRAS